SPASAAGGQEAPEAPQDAAPDNDADRAREDRRRTKSSPLVRNIAAEHGVDLTRVAGSGVSGRVTKRDILGYLDDRPTEGASSRGAFDLPAFRPGDAVDVVPMTVMRRKIAEHMIYSRRTSAHVHSVFEVDFA